MHFNVISGLFTIVGGLLTWFVVRQSILLQELKIKRREIERQNLEIIRKTQSTSILKGIEFVETLNMIMRSVFMHTQVDRVLILTIDVKTRIVSVIYEEHRDNSVSIRNWYHKQKVDREYVLMIEQLETIGHLLLITSDEPESFLKTAYLKEKVSSASLHSVGQVDVGDEQAVLLYLSFSTYEPTVLSEDDLSYITTLFRSIRTIFRSYLNK